MVTTTQVSIRPRYTGTTLASGTMENCLQSAASQARFSVYALHGHSRHSSTSFAQTQQHLLRTCCPWRFCRCCTVAYSCHCRPLPGDKLVPQHKRLAAAASTWEQQPQTPAAATAGHDMWCSRSLHNWRGGPVRQQQLQVKHTHASQRQYTDVFRCDHTRADRPTGGQGEVWGAKGRGGAQGRLTCAPDAQQQPAPGNGQLQLTRRLSGPTAAAAAA